MLVVAVAFQNCSKTEFSKMASSQDLKSTDGTLGTGDNSPPETTSGQESSSDDDGHSCYGHSGDSSDHPSLTADQNSRELPCAAAIHNATEIAYDSRVMDANAAPRSFRFILPSSIDAQNISYIGEAAAQNVRVTAGNISEINSLALAKMDVNAQTIGEISGIAGDMNIVTHDLNGITGIASGMCISAQHIGAIKDVSARLTIYGRSENGQKAYLDSIDMAAAFVGVHDMDIGKLGSYTALNGQFTNSHIGTLSGTGVIYLVDSTVDSIHSFTGTIYLKGNSQIPSGGFGAFNVIQEH